MEKDYTNLYEKLRKQLEDEPIEIDNESTQHIKSTVNKYLSKPWSMYLYKKQFNDFVTNYNEQAQTSFVTHLSKMLGYNLEYRAPAFKNYVRTDSGEWSWIKISDEDGQIAIRRYTRGVPDALKIYIDGLTCAGLPERHVSSCNGNRVSLETKLAKEFLGLINYKSKHTHDLLEDYKQDIYSITEKGVWKFLDKIYNREYDEVIKQDIKNGTTKFLPKVDGEFDWYQLTPGDIDKVSYFVFYSEKCPILKKLRVGNETLSAIYGSLRHKLLKVIDTIRELRNDNLQPYEILYRIQKLILERQIERRPLKKLLESICRIPFERLKAEIDALSDEEKLKKFRIFTIQDCSNTKKLYQYILNKLFENNFNKEKLNRQEDIKKLQYVVSMQNKKYGALINKVTDVVCFDIDNMYENNAKNALKYLITKFELRPENICYLEYSELGSGGFHVFVKLPEPVEINNYRKQFEKVLNENTRFKIEVRGSSQNTVLPLGVDYFPIDVEDLFENQKLHPVREQDWQKFVDHAFDEKVGSQLLFDALTETPSAVIEKIDEQLKQDIEQDIDEKQDIETKKVWSAVENQGCHDMCATGSKAKQPTLPLKKGQSNKQILWLADWYRNVLHKSFDEYFEDIQKSITMEGANASIYQESCFTSKSRYKSTWDNVAGSQYYKNFKQDNKLRKTPDRFMSNFNMWEKSTYKMLNQIGTSLSHKFVSELRQLRPGVASRDYITNLSNVLCSAFTSCFYAKALWEVTHPSFLTAKFSTKTLSDLRGIPLSIKYIKSFMNYVCDEIESNKFNELHNYVNFQDVLVLQNHIDEIRATLTNNVDGWRAILVSVFDLKYTESDEKFSYVSGVCKAIDLKNDNEVNLHLHNLFVKNLKSKQFDVITLKNITRNDERKFINVNGFYQATRNKIETEKLFNSGRLITKKDKLSAKTLSRVADKFKNDFNNVTFTNDVENETSDDNNTGICFAVYGKIKIIAKIVADYFASIFDNFSQFVDNYLHSADICDSSPPII